MKLSAYKDVTRIDLLPPGTYTTPVTVHDCEAVWDELTPTGCTITRTATNKVVGTYCGKIAMLSSAAVGLIASDAITLVDLTTAKFISLYIMCDTGVKAGDLQLILSDQALGAHAVKSLDIPMLRAGVMNRVVLPVGAFATGQDAIISVGFNMVRDLGACNLWYDQVLAHEDQPLIGDVIDILDYEDDLKLVLSVSKVNAGTTKTLDVVVKESSYPYDSFATMGDAAIAFTQVTTSMGSQEKVIRSKAGKRYIRAEVTLGSTDCSYSLALLGFGIKKTLGD